MKAKSHLGGRETDTPVRPIDADAVQRHCGASRRAERFNEKNLAGFGSSNQAFDSFKQAPNSSSLHIANGQAAQRSP